MLIQRLRAELKGLYQKWTNMSYVSLLISHKNWIVELKWEADLCAFGNGWLKFVKESGLEAGDTLVLFNSPVNGPNTVNVVICKAKDDLLQSTDGIVQSSLNQHFHLHGNI